MGDDAWAYHIAIVGGSQMHSYAQVSQQKQLKLNAIIVHRQTLG